MYHYEIHGEKKKCAQRLNELSMSGFTQFFQILLQLINVQIH